MFLKSKKSKLNRNKALEISNKEFLNYLKIFHSALTKEEILHLFNNFKNTLDTLTRSKEYPIYSCESILKNDLKIFFNSLSKTKKSLNTLKIASYIVKTFFSEENLYSNKLTKFLKNQWGNLVASVTLIVTIVGIIF